MNMTLEPLFLNSVHVTYNLSRIPYLWPANSSEILYKWAKNPSEVWQAGLSLC